MKLKDFDFGASVTALADAMRRVFHPIVLRADAPEDVEPPPMPSLIKAATGPCFMLEERLGLQKRFGLHASWLHWQEHDHGEDPLVVGPLHIAGQLGAGAWIKWMTEEHVPLQGPYAGLTLAELRALRDNANMSIALLLRLHPFAKSDDSRQSLFDAEHPPSK